MITKNVKLQILNFCIPEVVHGVLNDTDRYVSIEITDLPSGTNITSSTLYIKTPSGVIYQQAEAGLASGGICFDISKALKELGPNECTVKLQTIDGNAASTFIFIVECHPAAGESPAPAPTGGQLFTVELHYEEGGEQHVITKKYAYESGMTFAQYLQSEYNPIYLYTGAYSNVFFNTDDDVAVGDDSEGMPVYLLLDGEHVPVSTEIDGTATYTVNITI